jgi:microcystin-dependent protein
MASQNPSSVPTVLPNALPPINNAINNTTPQWLPYNGGAGTGVSAIVAGSGISITPTSGVGSVTVATVAASPYTVGMIMLWNSLVGLPTGWVPCDGAIVNGYTTPNLTNRFVVQTGGSGTNYPTIGLSGGADACTLRIDMIPDHTHGGTGLGTDSGTKTSGFSFTNGSSSTTGINNVGYTPGEQVPTRPPYYSLLYIIYVGVAP